MGKLERRRERIRENDDRLARMRTEMAALAALGERVKFVCECGDARAARRFTPPSATTVRLAAPRQVPV
jgi:hypothetical protein